MTSKRKELFAAALGIVSAIVLLLSFWSIPPRFDKSLHAEIGQALAGEALKLLKPGGKVVLIARDTEAFPQPAMAVLVDTIEAQIARAKREIRLVQHVQLDPIRPGAVPSGDFYELLRRAPEGDVIISLLGPPVLHDEERLKLGRPKASVVALCIGSPIGSMAVLFDAGLLHAGIVANPATTQRGVPEKFDQLYTVLRPNISG